MDDGDPDAEYDEAVDDPAHTEPLGAAHLQAIELDRELKVARRVAHERAEQRDEMMVFLQERDDKLGQIFDRLQRMKLNVQSAMKERDAAQSMVEYLRTKRWQAEAEADRTGIDTSQAEPL